ncbi:MAG TPA: hypothetical protein VFZ09_11365 [Archangium sp.]|uniref:hypothetical protein n=1 Tax=Archangium sp. TaxID=1872627 RepID=UPI002E31531D|nr:hypothetical protein [Archangium sp.]HEX5746833.1 hypothetical protein [Archangium sp.]
MKNAEGGAHPFELLDRRLKDSTAQLKDVTKVLENLGRSAGALRRMVGTEQFQESTRTGGRNPKAQSAPPPPPPARGSHATQGNASSASAAQDDIPEWRKVFPDLSSKVPGRGR